MKNILVEELNCLYEPTFNLKKINKNSGVFWKSNVLQNALEFLRIFSKNAFILREKAYLKEKTSFLKFWLIERIWTLHSAKDWSQLQTAEAPSF